MQTRGCDNFNDFLSAKQTREGAQQQLVQHLSESEWQPDSAGSLLALIRCLEYTGVATVVIKAIEEHYAPQGIEVENSRCKGCAPKKH